MNRSLVPAVAGTALLWAPVVCVPLSCVQSAPESASGRLRVVTLSPGLTEAVAVMGGLDHLVGVSDFCEHPPQACARPRVGHSLRPDLEAIVRLRPDVIVYESTQQGPGTDLSQLANVLALPWLTLDEVQGSVRELGRLIDREAAADRLANRLQSALGRPPNAEGPEVMLLIGYPEPSGSYWFIKPESLHGRLVGAAGGRAPPGLLDWTGPPKISAEALVRLDPEWIVVLAKDSATSSAAFAGLERLETLRSVRQHRLRTVTSTNIFTTGPRILGLVPRLRAALNEAPAR